MVEYFEHWTQTLAKQYGQQGYKYTIFSRGGVSDATHKGINSLNEMYEFLSTRYRYSSTNYPRVALLPHRDCDDIFDIMYYDCDGSYKVKGKIIRNERHIDIGKNYGNSN